METENSGSSSLVQLGFTAAYLLLLVPSFLAQRQPWRSSWTRAAWTPSKVVDCLAQTLLVVALVSALAVRLATHHAGHGNLDVFAVAFMACGSLASLLAIPYGYAPTARALYGFACCTLWALAYPFLWGSNFLAACIPALQLLGSIAVLGAAGDSSSLDNVYGVAHPATKAPSFLAYVTMSWLNPLLKYSASNILLAPNVWEVDNHLGVRHSLGEDRRPASRANWGSRPMPRQFVTFVLQNFRRGMLVSTALSLVDLAMGLVQPFLIQDLILNRKPSAIVWSVLVGVTQGLCVAHSLLLVRKIGMRTRSGLTALICDKGIGAASASASDITDPSVLIEVDLFNVFSVTENIHSLWSLPLQIILSLGAVIYILGWASVLAGCGFVVLTFPFFAISLRLMATALKRTMEAKDVRLSLINETLSRIKHIKLYGWQTVFERKIDETRAKEMKAAGQVAFYSSFTVFFSNILPVILASASFSTYLALGHGLTSAVVFPSLILFNAVKRAATMFPPVFISYQAGTISYKRIRAFLMATPSRCEDMHDVAPLLDSPVAQVTMIDASFDAPGDYQDTGTPILQNCTLHAAPGRLTVISGPTGCGKTTLVRAILGEVSPRNGSLHSSGRLAYAPQKPFLINGSIRDNILFGLPLDGPWYKRVVEAVCLQHDFTSLPDGDATFLEGTGTALSGGQQSRVGLARVIYARRPLVVLDDPLVAIDVKVQRQLLSNVFGSDGILKNTTRVITTGSPGLKRMAHALYMIEDGTIIESEPSSLDHGAEETPSDALASMPVQHSPGIYGSVPETAPEGLGVVRRSSILASIPLTISNGTQELGMDVELAPIQTTTVPGAAASVDTGVAAVHMRTYLSYLKAGKRWGWFLVFLSATCCIILGIIAVTSLRQVGEEFDTVGESSKLIYYIISGVSGGFLSIVFMLVAFFMCVLPASRSIHALLVSGIMRSKFGFFDTTPLGHILNRFTNDINRVDSAVGGGFIILVMIGLIVIFSLLAIVAISPLTIFYLVPVMSLYRFLQIYYMHACRQLRRLDNNARNPILNAANEMKTGSTVIQIFDQVEFFRNRARDLIDQHVRVWMPFLCLDIWLQLRLFGLVCSVGGLTAGLLLYLDAPSSTLGFVMNFLLEITGLLGLLVQILARLEADLISLERIYTYANNIPEDESCSFKSRNDQNDLGRLEPAQATSWPANPSIVMENYNASYRPGGALCLRNLNFSIAGGERIAVVGRTGAGKSSLMLALMRALDDLAVRPGSRIVIDGHDILQDMSTLELRKRITVIPQEPVVFGGTLQENLDPLGDRSASELRDAVERCNLAKGLGIEGVTDPLKYPISEGGRHLSTGQAQLLAITRAVAERRSIVIIDEATASVDHEAAILINNVMQRAFDGSTVITIAHQIATVINCDRILVLDHGSVVEFDRPETLLNDPKSMFRQMAKEAGFLG